MSVDSGEVQSIKVITDWDSFVALKGDWQRLLKQSDADTIFLTWEWVDCWRKSQKAKVAPFILVIEQSGQIIGIAPFYIKQYRLASLLTYQALRFVGDQGSGAEYANFIVEHKKSEKIKVQLWRYLLSAELSKQWDFIWLSNVAAWSEGGKTLLRSLSTIKALHYHQRVIEFAQLPLAQFDEDILTHLSKSLRTNIRQTTKRLNKLGPWKITITTQNKTLPDDLEHLFRLHNHHWRDAGLMGAFQRQPELLDFYRFFAPIALDKGWLKLLSLESQGDVQAMQLGYLYKNNFLALQEGYNPDFLPGIGQVLRHFSVNHCIKEKLNCYDFLGVYTDHKRRWLAEKKIGQHCFIWQNKLINMPFFLKKIWPTGRFLKPI